MRISFDIRTTFQNKLRFGTLIAMLLLSLVLCFLFHIEHPSVFKIMPLLLILALPICAGLDIRIEKPVFSIIFHIALTLGLALLYLYCGRKINRLDISSLNKFRIEMNVLIYCAFVFMLYCITGKSRLSYALSFSVLLLLEIINYYVIKFRGSELSPSDLLTIGTAANIVGNYHIALSTHVLNAILIDLLVVYFVSFTLKIYESNRMRLCAAAALIVQIAVIQHGLNLVHPQHFQDLGTCQNGFALNFLKSTSEIIVKRPEQYAAMLTDLENKYADNSEFGKLPANIIVVMNESFADFRVFADELYTDEDIMPFFDSLEENTIKGYALSSVLGGGTPNSEWEFLFGSSKAFMPSGTIPYQTHIRNDGNHTILSHLKSLGYHSIAMHPSDATNWARSSVYPKLGFDEQYFQEDFPQQELVHREVSDREVYREIIKKVDGKQPGEKLFLFAVTMQNHGPYSYSSDAVTSTVQIHAKEDFPYTEQYFSLIRQSDAAVEELITYFQNADEDTVILFFGDHQPNLEEDYFDYLYPEDFDSLSSQELKYMVPFFVWANFEISEEKVDCTSLNYLSNYLYRAAGLPKTGFNRFLTDMEAQIPAINALGYYSRSEHCFLPLEYAQGEEAQWLEQYRVLQYNSVFDKKYSSTVFTPSAY